MIRAIAVSLLLVTASSCAPPERRTTTLPARKMARASLPPFPAPIIKSAAALEFPPIPSSWGWSFLNRTSGLPRVYWTFGYSGLPDVFIPFDFMHNPLTGEMFLSWDSNPTNQYRIWWTHTNAPLYPLAVYWTNVLRGTNWEQWPQFPTLIAWTNSTRTEIAIPGPTNRTGYWPGYPMVGRVK